MISNKNSRSFDRDDMHPLLYFLVRFNGDPLQVFSLVHIPDTIAWSKKTSQRITVAFLPGYLFDVQRPSVARVLIGFPGLSPLCFPGTNTHGRGHRRMVLDPLIFGASLPHLFSAEREVALCLLIVGLS